jgi:hypothetical protein
MKQGQAISVFCLILAQMATACFHQIRPEYPVPLAPLKEDTLPRFESNIHVELHLPFESLSAQLLHAFPPSGPEDKSCKDVPVLGCARHGWYREPIISSFSDSRLQMQTTLWYAVHSVSSKVGCGTHSDPERRATFRLQTRLELTSEWGLKASGMTAGKDHLDSCRIGFQGAIDISGTVRPLIDKALDEAAVRLVEAIDTTKQIREKAESLWILLHNPIPLGDSWLSLHPTAVRATQLAALGSDVRTLLTFTTSPQLVGVESPETRLESLPALQPGEAPAVLDFASAYEIPFAAISDSVRAHLVGNSFVNTRYLLPKQTVRIDSAFVVGAGQRAFVVLTLGGVVRGPIYLEARLSTERDGRIVRLDSLDLSSSSRAALHNAAPWLADPLTWRTRFQLSRMELDLTPQIEKAHRRFEAALNFRWNPTTLVAAKLDPPRLYDVHTRRTGVFALIYRTTGAMKVTVDQPDDVRLATKLIALSLTFYTGGQDKDEEEPVDLWIFRGGDDRGNGWTELGYRRLGVAVVDISDEGQKKKKWDNNSTQGPFNIPITPGIAVGTCDLRVRFRKEPAGSQTGKDWKVSLEVKGTFTDATERVLLRTTEMVLGDDNEFDKGFRVGC